MGRSGRGGGVSRGPADRCWCQVAPTPAVHHSATQSGTDASDLTVAPLNLQTLCGRRQKPGRVLRVLRVLHVLRVLRVLRVLHVHAPSTSVHAPLLDSCLGAALPAPIN